MNTCIFCSEAKDPCYANGFLGPDWPYNGRILVETDGVFAVPGYGPQVYPYILIITRRHISSLTETTRSEREEIYNCLSLLARHKPLELDSPFVFEHAGCSNIHSCVEHFHLHVVSAKYDVSWALAELNPKPICISAESGLVAAGAYLLAARFDGQDHLYGQMVEVREKVDQFFRRAIAAELGSKEWDWRIGMNMEFMVRQMQACRQGVPTMIPKQHAATCR